MVFTTRQPLGDGRDPSNLMRQRGKLRQLGMGQWLPTVF